MKKSKNYQLTKDKFLTHQEQRELLKFLNSPNTPKRDQLLIEVALATGARASELLNLRFKDLSLSNRSVQITGLKGSNDREIPLPKKLFARLYDLASSGPEKRPFPISYPRLVQIWNYHAPANKTFHSLRHTFALNLYEKKKDIRLLQYTMGHRSINNTMIYAQYNYTQTELRKAMGIR